MKLYPLLYEAAKGAEDALKKRLVIYGENRGTSNTITLFSPFAFSKIIKQIEQEEGLFDPSSHPSLIIKKAAKQATIGEISYELLVNNGLAQIATSAAIGGFGPLVYQVVMYLNPDLWLASDYSLKPASEKIWQKMYEFSNQGMYERKFLGEFNEGVRKLLIRARIDRFMLLNGYFKKVLNNEILPTEEVFLNWLKENNLNPSDFGYLWAYKKSQHDPKIEELFKGGERFIQQAEDVFNMRKEDLKNIITGSGSRLFHALYGSEASYTRE